MSVPDARIPQRGDLAFFLPNWDDRVDPGYDFERDAPTPGRDRYHDLYAQEVYPSPPYAGQLVSWAVMEDSPQTAKRAHEVGLRAFLRLPEECAVMADCGAFQYRVQHEPPFSPEEMVRHYIELRADLGISVDHIIHDALTTRTRHYRRQGNLWLPIAASVFEQLEREPKAVVQSSRFVNGGRTNGLTVLLAETEIDQAERERRWHLTLHNGERFLRAWREAGQPFVPIGACQGWDPDSYAEGAERLAEMGYDYIAIGGVADPALESSEIVEIVGAVSDRVGDRARIHVLGQARPELLADFVRLEVTSVDSSALLIRAWQDDRGNYLRPDTEPYLAVRVPCRMTNVTVLQGLRSGKLDPEVTARLEQDALTALRGLGEGVSAESAAEAVLAHTDHVGLSLSIRKDDLMRTLTDAPWRHCPCEVCQQLGVEVIVYRGANRNRRRGFHNIWVFHNALRQLVEGDRRTHTRRQGATP